MGITLFTCGKMEVVGQRFIFDESGAVYICTRDDENVNFGDENGIAFYSFYFNLIHYTFQLTAFCSVMDGWVF